MMKANIRSPNPSRQPHTFELLQAYVVPPHCKAMSKHTKAAINKKAPAMSILASFCFNVNDNARCVGRGGLRYTAMMAKATNPMAVCCQHFRSTTPLTSILT